MKNVIQKKNEKSAIRFLVVFTLLFLVISIPPVSAGWFSDTVGSVGGWVSRVVDTVKGWFGGGGGSSSSGSSQNSNSNYLGGGSGGSSGGSGGGGNDGGSQTYNPWGSGSMPDPVVKQDPSYITPSAGGGALYHDVDIASIDFYCINCPSTHSRVSGFDYALEIRLLNKGNHIAEGVNLEVNVEYPDGETDDYSFKTNRLWINPGAYDFKFRVPSVGLEDNGEIKDYAKSSGTINDVPIKVTVLVEDDDGLDRAEIRYKITPQRECKWSGSLFSGYSYVCEELEPIRTEQYVCLDGSIIKEGSGKPTAEQLKKCVIESDTKEDTYVGTEIIDTISPTLWSGGGLRAFS